MVVWNINRIPTVQENKNMYHYMRQILFSLQNLSHTNVSLELVFFHVTGEEIGVYFFLRNIFNNAIASAIEMQLTVANFQFERLDEQSTAAISQQLIDIACTELNAVVKTEKIVTTPFMQEGYYYWADALLAGESKETDNFTIVYLGDGVTDFRLELTWLKDRTEAYDLGESEYHLAFVVDDYEAAYKKHKEMGCICFENPTMGIYFITDPDEYWLEVVPTRK